MTVTTRRVLAALLVWSMAAAWPAQAETRPVLRVGTGHWAPYVEQSAADGGALVRLLRAVLAEAGYDMKLSYYPWDRNILLLRQGQLDLLLPYSCGPQRLVYALCSDPLTYGEMVLFHHRSQSLDWQAINDLKGLRIGTTLGYSYGETFDRAVEAGELTTEVGRNEETSFRLLAYRRLDAYVQDRAVGYHTLRQMAPIENVYELTHHARPINREALRVMARRDDPDAQTIINRINTVLARLMEAGDLERLQQALNQGEAASWQPGRR